MAEKIDERRVQISTNGTALITLPRAYVDDVGIGKKSVMVILREGKSIIMKPKEGDDSPCEPTGSS